MQWLLSLYNYLSLPQANWADYYEPYVVTERELTPKYWEGFVGRFYNKASHLAELFAMG